LTNFYLYFETDEVYTMQFYNAYLFGKEVRRILQTIYSWFLVKRNKIGYFLG
jgi:hypothetical protein